MVVFLGSGHPAGPPSRCGALEAGTIFEYYMTGVGAEPSGVVIGRVVVRHAAVLRVARVRLSIAGGCGPEPHGGSVIPPEGFHGGGASMPIGHTGPVPV